jgi:hypothetical protein
VWCQFLAISKVTHDVEQPVPHSSWKVCHLLCGTLLLQTTVFPASRFITGEVLVWLALTV